jgi:hypothetical protein
VAPDNSHIVYSYFPDVQANPQTPELRMMNIDGTDDHLLAAGGWHSDWSRVAPQVPTPTATAQPTATPQPTATTQPAMTATPQTQPTPNATPQIPLFLPNVTR